ncbi:MAG: cyclic lactone autoinducer peptide [Bacillota bacterium]|nr:cyclic lactone autoinducer peptide [Bacillota bacterium]
MRRIKYLILTGLTTALVLVAQVSAASACAWAHYQPEIPNKLAKY